MIKEWFALEDNWLKNNSKTRKKDFTTGRLNYILMVKTTPMELYFMLPLEVPKIWI